MINRYIIKQKLRNNFWLAYDIKYGNYVSIKIKKISSEENNEQLEIDFLKKIYKHNFSEEWIKSLKEYYKNDEYILSEINFEEHTNIIQMLNSFMYKEEENSVDIYLCNIYEILGDSLQDVFDKYKNKNINNINKAIPLPYLRIIAKQILIGLDFIHRFGGIIHNNLNMDNILICLTKEELEIINETGYLFIDEGKNDGINLENNVIKDIDHNSRQIKRQEKQMEKMELSQNDKNKNDLGTNNNNINFNINEINKILGDKYDINELISRPRIASVPKYDLKNNKYNFDINSYNNEIQTFIKEKNRIKSDSNYRKKIAIKKNFIELIDNYNSKIEILKKLNKEYALNDFIFDSDIKIKITGFNQYIKINNKKININSKQRDKYLPPEIILNSDYNETIDIWALACIIFELATGEPLFDAESDANFSKKENHIWKFIEILGNIPNKIIQRMVNPKIFIDLLKKLTEKKNLNKISILELLRKKYHFKNNESVELNDFLLEMLNYLPEKRPSARKMLSHPWLNMPSNFDYIDKEDKEEIENIILNNENANKKEDINHFANESSCEEYAADDEDNDKVDNLDNFEEDEDSGDDNPDKINIPNYNNSFAQYGQFIDLTSLDKANPQFNEIIKMDESE